MSPSDKLIFWHQGLFLQPQHLQLSDRFHATRLKAFLEYGEPFLWGVAELDIQESTLSNKIFEITKGQFIFPEGAHIQFPGNAVIKPRSFDDAWVDSDKPFTVYLGLKKWSREEPNVTVVPDLDEVGSVRTRYVAPADPEEVRDLYGTGPNASVKTLTMIANVFWETEVEGLNDYQLMPVAQLRREGEEIILARNFTPPLLTVSASDQIKRMVKDIHDQVMSRCRQLEEYKSPKEAIGMGLDPAYIVFLLALRSLNRWAPMLQHLAETKHVHPWRYYGVLRQVIGELSTFSDSVGASGENLQGERVLPAYDHNDLWSCFSAAQSLISRLLDGISVGPGHLIRLVFDGKYYSGEFSERMIRPDNQYWLVLRSETGGDDLITAVDKVVKLSARRNLSTLIARAIPGVGLEYFPTPPPGLPRRAHSYYFRIDQASRQWKDIEAAQTVSLFWDTAPEDLSAEIIVLRS